eukprot:COSAG05_NODE_1086_length_5923_cov_254.414492_2_plen_406_part_00
MPATFSRPRWPRHHPRWLRETAAAVTATTGTRRVWRCWRDEEAGGLDNLIHGSGETTLSKEETQLWLQDWERAKANAIPHQRQRTVTPHTQTPMEAWTEVALSEARVVNSGYCMDEAILQTAPRRVRRALMQPLAELRVGTSAAAHIAKNRKLVEKVGGYWRKHDEALWYDRGIVSPQTYGKPERKYDSTQVASVFNPKTKKIEHITPEEYQDEDIMRAKGLNKDGWMWLRHLQCTEITQPRRRRQTSTVQGLDQSHYKEPEDIAAGLLAAKTVVIVFTADTTGEVTPKQCAPLAAPDPIRQHGHNVLHSEGQRIEAGWTISVVEHMKDHFNAVHAFRLIMPRRRTHSQTSTGNSTATMRVSSKSIRTPAQSGRRHPENADPDQQVAKKDGAKYTLLVEWTNQQK